MLVFVAGREPEVGLMFERVIIMGDEHSALVCDFCVLGPHAHYLSLDYTQIANVVVTYFHLLLFLDPFLLLLHPE